MRHGVSLSLFKGNAATSKRNVAAPIWLVAHPNFAYGNFHFARQTRGVTRIITGYRMLGGIR
jgi:hypothetical protein